MHIKDLKMDVELEIEALAAISGGSCSGVPNCQDGPAQAPIFPSFGGDWTQLNTDIKGYIGDVKAGAGFPSAEVSIPDITIPETSDIVF